MPFITYANVSNTAFFQGMKNNHHVALWNFPFSETFKYLYWAFRRKVPAKKRLEW